MSATPRIAIVGCGGLGGPIALTLGAAGLRLTLIDPDVVEVGNLHRQIQFVDADVGRAKVDALADALEARGLPRPRTARARFTTSDAARLVADADVVVDGTDDPATKFAIGDWATGAGRRHVIAAAIGYGGTVFVGAPGRGCFRCLFEAPPAAAATCAADGVLGPAVGAVAGWAAEAARALAAGDLAAAGTILRLVDARADAAPRSLTISVRPDCAAPHGRTQEQPMATIRIPTPLRKLTDGKEEVAVQATTVGAALAELERLHPGIRARLFDEAGTVKKFINLYANDEDVRGLQQLDTPLRDTDELSIVPAIAGG